MPHPKKKPVKKISPRAPRPDSDFLVPCYRCGTMVDRRTGTGAAWLYVCCNCNLKKSEQEVQDGDDNPKGA